jgi:hypothetical protein
VSIIVHVENAGAIEWRKIRGIEFSGDEARDASDFSEVVGNFGLTPDESYEMFKDDRLTVGKRLYLAEKLSLDKATAILLLDEDARIGKVVNERLKEAKRKEDGGIII